jgi:Trk K+ transport system NAD-binding subunit
MFKIQVDADSVLAGRSIVDALGEMAGVTAVAVLRRDQVLIPRGPTMMHVGDELVVMATAAAAGELGEDPEPGAKLADTAQEGS